MRRVPHKLARLAVLRSALPRNANDGREVLLVSITHLTFDRRLPLAREIAAYQKHRVKRLRRSGPAGGAGPSH